MKALIFGINGQDGYYLSHLLKENQIEVVGISRAGNFIGGSVADYSFVEKQIKLHKPAYVFHLAANSTTQHYALFENHETISTGTLNILETVYKFSPKTKVFLSGSAMQFENKGIPIDEKTPWSASSPYSVARIQSVYAGRYYRKLGIEVYVGYFFNHDSPLRTEKHVNQKIAKAVQRIKQGTLEKIELGNTEVRKEFNYAGDVVEAVWKLVNQSTIFETVIGCGKAYSIREWLDCCFKMANKNWQDFVEIRQDFVPEYQILVSNPRLIKSLGWEPKIDFTQLAKMMMGDI